jgi:hypothetical protein
MRQPQTMDEMVRSVITTHNEHPGSVIQTVATVPVDQIPTAYRPVASAYQAHALVVGNGIGNYPLNAKIEVSAQTDMFFMGVDRDGQFGRMVGLLNVLGKKIR